MASSANILLALLALILFATPATATDLIVGDSWACLTGDRLQNLEDWYVLCRGASDSSYWNHRYKEILGAADADSTIYLSIGGVDSIFWIADGRQDDSKWHPKRTAKRVFWLIKRLRKYGHRVVLLGYIPEFYPSYQDLIFQKYVLRFDGLFYQLGRDGLHLKPLGYILRAQHIVTNKGLTVNDPRPF